MARAQIKRTFQVGERLVTVVAYDQIAVEDCYGMLVNAVLHRYLTAEDVVPTIPRDVKDALIKLQRAV